MYCKVFEYEKCKKVSPPVVSFLLFFSLSVPPISPENGLRKWAPRLFPDVSHLIHRSNDAKKKEKQTKSKNNDSSISRADIINDNTDSDDDDDDN